MNFLRTETLTPGNPNFGDLNGESSMSAFNPNDFFSNIELFLVRLAVFVIFLVGLYKVAADTLKKILK